MHTKRQCACMYSWAEEPQLQATQRLKWKLQRHTASLRPIGNYWSQQSQSEIVLAKANAAFPQWKPRRGFRYWWKLIASDFQFQRQSSLIPKWIFIQEQSHVCSHYFRLSTLLDLLPCMLGWVEGFKKNSGSDAHLLYISVALLIYTSWRWRGPVSRFVFLEIHILWSIYISINLAGISFIKGKKKLKAIHSTHWSPTRNNRLRIKNNTNSGNLCSPGQKLGRPRIKEKNYQCWRGSVTAQHMLSFSLALN